jgi:Zn-dependent peptidase ImmA (M78 family)
MVRVLESQGIIVTTARDISSKVDAFCNDDYFPIIVRNNTKSNVRCRFDLAHEFAHLILHQGVTNDIIKYPEIENQANYFASSFLLPRSTFIAEFPRFNNGRIPWFSLIELKKRWKVSIASLITRAFHLGIIDSNARKRAFIGISTKGWRTKEPLDDINEVDSITEEKPELIRNAVNMIMNTHTDFLPKMKDTLLLEPNLIKEIIGMPNLSPQKFIAHQNPPLRVVK